MSCFCDLLMFLLFYCVFRTMFSLNVNIDTIQAICRDGRIVTMSYESQQLRDFILCQVMRILPDSLSIYMAPVLICRSAVHLMLFSFCCFVLLLRFVALLEMCRRDNSCGKTEINPAVKLHLERLISAYCCYHYY